MRVAFRKRERSLFGLAIRLWTRSDFSHCEIIFGRAMISAVPDEGVRLTFLPDPLSSEQWSVIDIPTTVAQGGLVYSWAYSEIGSKYDWLGILLAQVFRFGRQHKERWFCSEFCTAALQQLGIATNVKPYHQNPGSLFHLLKGFGYEIR